MRFPGLILHTITVRNIGEKDFAMSNELISALENRVTSAVDTIEGLRSELRVLREERQLLENKLRELLQKIEGVEGSSDDVGSGSAPEVEAVAPPAQQTHYGFGSPAMGSSSSEY